MRKDILRMVEFPIDYEIETLERDEMDRFQKQIHDSDRGIKLYPQSILQPGARVQL